MGDHWLFHSAHQVTADMGDAVQPQQRNLYHKTHYYPDNKTNYDETLRNISWTTTENVPDHAQASYREKVSRGKYDTLHPGTRNRGTKVSYVHTPPPFDNQIAQPPPLPAELPAHERLAAPTKKKERMLSRTPGSKRE